VTFSSTRRSASTFLFDDPAARRSAWLSLRSHVRSPCRPPDAWLQRFVPQPSWRCGRWLWRCGVSCGDGRGRCFCENRPVPRNTQSYPGLAAGWLRRIEISTDCPPPQTPTGSSPTAGPDRGRSEGDGRELPDDAVIPEHWRSATPIGRQFHRPMRAREPRVAPDRTPAVRISPSSSRVAPGRPQPSGLLSFGAAWAAPRADRDAISDPPPAPGHARSARGALR
jgi:hypothetical protein